MQNSPLAMLAAAVASVSLSLPAAAAGPNNPFQIGAWHAGSFTNDQTGAFTQCSGSVTYKSNITMFVVVNRAGAWSLGFSHPQWALGKGDRIPIQLKFDGGMPNDETGIVLLSSPTLVEVPMPATSQLIKSFRAAAQMTAVARGQTFVFRLDSTSQLLPALANCVRTALLAETTKPGVPNNSNTASDAYAIEEMQLATNFLLAARLSNARVINRADAPPVLAALGATWKADDAVGAVKIYAAAPGQSGLELASGIIARDAQSCQGKFASARSSELSDSDVVFRAGTSCSDSNGERSLQYFITPWHKSNFAVFAVMGTRQSTESPGAGDARENMFTKAVLGAAAQKQP